MKEALLESTLRKMRLARVLPSIQAFSNPSVLDIGCGWEARLLHEIEPYIASGVGIDFKAPEIRTEKLHTFSYFFEPKDFAKTGGGGAHLERVGFGAKNGDYCGEPAVITTQGNSLDSPCKAPFLSPKSNRERLAPNEPQAAGFCKNAITLSEQAKDSRICDEKSGFFKDSQGRALGVRNRRESAEIHDLSREAESTNPTPPPHKLCHLPFPNESFEIITMLAVLEHLNYPLAMLQEIARVLKPNGILLLTVPSHLAKPVLEFLAFRLKIVSEAEIADHKRYYNKRDLRELVASVPELTLTKHTYFQLGMNNFCIIHKRA